MDYYEQLRLEADNLKVLLDVKDEEIEHLWAVRAAAQKLLSLGIINPTGSAEIEAAKAALAAAIEASN